ncbi:hypothetical protein Hypma_003113 [Hypsizygus marmoreus]|uniref:Uncharacterized protein n=1 Tax=Hypsizygus marmoreus TaxID=39966 RepID=A0A369J2I2_HYPMA|nr:hypothetical protein Hypma_003113 [Hypsizygus marmoreus]
MRDRDPNWNVSPSSPSATTHVSDSVDENNEPLEPRHPSRPALQALLDHFRHYTHLEDSALLRNNEYCATLRDLIWINRVETTELKRCFGEFHERLQQLEERSERHFQELEARMATVMESVATLANMMLELKDIIIKDSYTDHANISNNTPISHSNHRSAYIPLPPRQYHSSPPRRPFPASPTHALHHRSCSLPPRHLSSSSNSIRRENLVPSDFSTVQLNRIRMVRDGFVSFPNTEYHSSPVL